MDACLVIPLAWLKLKEDAFTFFILTTGKAICQAIISWQLLSADFSITAILLVVCLGFIIFSFFKIHELFPASFTLSLLFSAGLSKFERLMAGIAFAVIVSGIITTQSRGGLLGIMAICGFFAWHKVKSKALLIGGVAVLLPILLLVAGISDRSSGGAGESGIDESSMGRLYAWEAAFKIALANPLTGVGLDNCVVNYFAYSDHWDGMNHAVHSTKFNIFYCWIKSNITFLRALLVSCTSRFLNVASNSTLKPC
jgi:hypothetical protein